MQESHVTGNKETTVSSTTEAGTAISQLMTAHAEAVGGDRDRELPNSIGGTDVQNPRSILERRTRLTSGVLSSGDVQWNAVLSNYDPWTAWLAIPLVAAHLTGYQRLRADFEIEIVVTAPPSSYGMYIAGAVCEVPKGKDTVTYSDLDGPTSDNPFTLSQDIHAMIDLSTSTTVRLKLPWVHPLDALDLQGTLSEQLPFWRIMIYPLSKLRSASTSDAVTATYTVYGRLLPGYSLSVATYQAKTAFRKGRGAKYDEQSSGGAVSSTLAKVGQTATMVGEAIPFLAPFAGPVAIGSSLASKIASMFGFTRESTVETPDRVIHRLFSPLTVIDGTDGSESVALLSDASTSIDPRIGGGIEGDPCTYEDLFSRWTLVASDTWTDADSPNTLLHAMPVGPGVCNELLGIRYPSTSAYVGMPFRYWRGSMEYMIVVPTSPFHRGTLQVSWDPGDNYVDGSDVTNRQNNVIFDVDTTNSITLKVGYVSPDPCKEFQMFTSQSAFAWPTQVSFNGMLSIRVQGALRAQSSPTTVDILVFARAGKDMRFGVPALTRVNNVSGSFKRTLGTWQLQAGGIGDDVEPEDTVVQLVGKDGDEYPTAAILWGEDIASVRALMQKPSFYCKFNTDPISGGVSWKYAGLPAFPLYIPPPYPSGYQEVVPTWWSDAKVREQFTWFAWYAAMFVGVRGSMRVKVLGRTPQAGSGGYNDDELALQNFVTCQACSGRDLISGDVGGTGFGTQMAPDMSYGGVPHAGVQQNSGTSFGQEFTVPYYGMRKFETNRRVFKFTGAPSSMAADYKGWGPVPMFAVGQLSANSYINMDATTLSWPPLAVFVGGGPDIAPVRFRRCPALRAPVERPLIVALP